MSLPTKELAKSPDFPLRVAIVGSGASSLFVADHLLHDVQDKLRKKAAAGAPPVSAAPGGAVPSTAPVMHVLIDIFEQLPVPFGLIRYGIAPHHESMKGVTKFFSNRVLTDERVRFFGNVKYGRDLQYPDLKRHFDAIVMATGTPGDRKLGIPGEDSVGSMSATEFVFWYNGHPDYMGLSDAVSRALVKDDPVDIIVVGVGNSALDVARILASPPESLAKTDIADPALDVLRRVRPRNVYVLARRGAPQVKFSYGPLLELGELSTPARRVRVVVKSDELERSIGPEGEEVLKQDVGARAVVNGLRKYAAQPIDEHFDGTSIVFRFLAAPARIHADDSGRVKSCVIERTRLTWSGTNASARGTGETEELQCAAVLRSIGYYGLPLEGFPFDEKTGGLCNIDGRIIERAEAGAQPRLGEYVTGWARRGATGMVAHAKPDAAQVAASIVDDLQLLEFHARRGMGPPPPPGAFPKDASPSSEAGPAGSPPFKTPLPRLPVQWERNLLPVQLWHEGVRWISFRDYRIIEEAEKRAGQAQGRPRVKICRTDDMLALLGPAPT